MSDIETSLQEIFDEHAEVVAQSRALLPSDFASAVRLCEESLTDNGKLLFFGNGGSAADAQHIATEFVVKLGAERAPLAALALTTDTSSLTATGNDFGFDYIFSRQIEALGQQSDVAIAISTSGNSKNVILAVEAARAKNMKVIGLTGASGGELAARCDICIKVPSSVTNRIQEIHITLLHGLCGILEQRLGLV